MLKFQFASLLGWEELINQDHIQVWCASSAGGDFALIDTVGEICDSYTGKTVENGTENFYRIIPNRDMHGCFAEGDFSNTVGAKIPD